MHSETRSHLTNPVQPQTISIRRNSPLLHQPLQECWRLNQPIAAVIAILFTISLVPVPTVHGLIVGEANTQYVSESAFYTAGRDTHSLIRHDGVGEIEGVGDVVAMDFRAVRVSGVEVVAVRGIAGV